MSHPVDDYLDALPNAQKVELGRIRNLVKTIVPEATESISYMMPAFKFAGKPLLYYAAFKDHLSVFPTSGPVAELEKELNGFVTGKGTIQFTLEKPLPDAVLEKIVRSRMDQIKQKR